MQKTIQGLLVIIALLLGCIVGGMFSRSARSQGESIPSANIPLSPVTVSGRYQLTVTSTGIQWLIDTQTGRVWNRIGGDYDTRWEEHTPDYSKASVVERPK